MSWMEEQDDRECEYGYLESSAIKNLESRLSHLSAVNEKLKKIITEMQEAGYGVSWMLEVETGLETDDQEQERKAIERFKNSLKLADEMGEK